MNLVDLKKNNILIYIQKIKEMRFQFLYSIESMLGDRYSNRLRSIYEIIVDYLLKTISEGFEEK